MTITLLYFDSFSGCYTNSYWKILTLASEHWIQYSFCGDTQPTSHDLLAYQGKTFTALYLSNSS